MMCSPPGSSTVGAPGAISIAATGRILATSPSMTCVCSVAFSATGLATAISRSTRSPVTSRVR